ncbi:MAG: NMD3-related protein [Candidatus Micrarchaeaceae archaeon]
MPRHCATCQRVDSEAVFFGDFCEYCTIEKLKSELPAEARIKKCKRCERIWTGTRFAAPTQKAVENALALQIKGYSVHVLGFNGGSITAELEKDMDGLGILKFNAELMVKEEKTVCDDCYKRSSGYWEACIQLRGGEAGVRKAADKIERYVAHTGSFITKSEDVPNGIDIYISSKKTANEMMLYFHMKPTVTYTLYGVRQGKKVYRNTYSIHFK